MNNIQKKRFTTYKVATNNDSKVCKVNQSRSNDPLPAAMLSGDRGSTVPDHARPCKARTGAVDRLGKWINQ